MSATTLAPAPARRTSATLPATPVPADFRGALRSEWTKIRTVRSTFWTLVATIAVSVGFSTLFAWGTASHDTAQALARMDVPVESMRGLMFGQLVIVVFGALAITSEFTTGMIRTSFTSMPRRGVVYTAKALIVAAVSLVVGLTSSFASFLIGSAFFAGKGIHVGLGDPNVLRAVIGGGLFLAVCSLLAFGLGAIIRHTAGAITAGVGALFLLWMTSLFLPASWRDSIGRWIPFNAGSQVWSTQNTAHMFTAWTGFAVFAAYAMAATGAGLLLIRKRDA